MNHILIVDDEAEIRESLGEILKEDGYTVTTTATASEALILLRDASYDVMLLDIGLPDMDGYEVAREMRASPELANIRLVALTGYGQAEDKQRARSAGFDDHLVKPVEFPALQRVLAGLKNRR